MLDEEVAKDLADQSLEQGVEALARNRKLVKMGLIRVAKAIAEGRMKVTMADLDRLVRLEEFLREEEKAEGTKFVLEWHESCGKPEEVDGGDDGTAK
jgi:3-methyladenine DNA glycosylase AlkD